MTIYHWIGIVLFVLFCIVMIWQIESDIRDTRRILLKGYGFANATHVAQTFDKTGVVLDTGFKYHVSPYKKPNREKIDPVHQKTDNSSLDTDL